MAYKAVLTESAERDRRGIVYYLSHSLQNPSAAQKFLDEFDDKVQRVLAHPQSCELCRVLSAAYKGYRVALVGSYLFVYKVDDAAWEVVILRVFHQRQDYAKFL